MHSSKTHNCLGRFLFRAKSYFRENWGSPFILIFILLLISAAFSLSIGFPDIADNIAVYAFYALVIGVVLQLASFLKYGQKNEVENL